MMIIPKLAIWKGFPFRYRDVQRSPENALEVIQFAGGPYWQIVENSRGPDAIRIQAVFLGPLAATEKAAFNLIAALPGPGVLIHPDLGITAAYLKSWPVSSAGQVQDFFSMDLEFVPIADLPGTEIAFSAAVSAATITMLAAGAAEFTANLPDADDSGAAVSLTSANNAAATALASLPGLVSGDKQNRMTLALGVAAIAGADETIEAWNGVAALVDTPAAASTALSDILTNWQAAVDLQATNYTRGMAEASMYEYLAAAMLARLGKLALDEAYETYDDAANAATSVYGQMGDVLTRMTGNGVVAGAIKVQALTYSGLITEALSLPKRVLFETRSVMSSVELAYNLYGDYDRADEIERDNDISHPGFLAADFYRVVRA